METHPCSIDLPGQPMDCSISCIDPLVATGLVSGQILVHRYSSQPSRSGSTAEDAATTCPISAAEVLRRESPKGASCRAVAFSSDSSSLLAGFETGSLVQLDASSGKLAQRLSKAQPAAVNRLLPLVSQPQLVAVGDEEGGLAVWDLRSKAAAWSYSKHTDSITGLSTDAKESCLLAVSADGTLSVHDLRSRKPLARSEDDADDELLSVVVMKHSKKVVCGSQSGVLSIFSWGYWNDCSDRFPGHPESVDAIVAFDEDTIITGSSDGALRVLNVLPNKLLGVVGEHADMPLERLALSGDHRVLASTSHDTTVKLWDLSCLHDDDDDEEEEEEDEESEEEAEEAQAATAAGAASTSGRGNADKAAAVAGTSQPSAAGDDDGDDSNGGGGADSSSDEEDGAQKRKKRRREKTAMSKGRNKPSKSSNFFADLL